MTAILTILANLSTPLFWVGLVITVVGMVGSCIMFIVSKDHTAFGDDWAVERRDAKRWFFAGMAGVFSMFASYAVYGIDEPFIREVPVVKYEPLPYEEYMKSCAPAYNLTGAEVSQAYFKLRERCAEMAVSEMKGLLK